jgi:hypothetical protein
MTYNIYYGLKPKAQLTGLLLAKWL